MATTSKRRGNEHSRQRPASARAKAAPKKPRRGDTNGKTKQAAKSVSKAAKKTTGAVAKPVPKPGKLTRKVAATAAKKFATKFGGRALEAIRTAADRAAATGSELTDVVEKPASKRLPIQRSVDIAVPIAFAWQEWMELETLPEGTHVVTEIERDGDELTGQIDGPRNADWSAEVLDEREQQSFAWQSHEGSDCAGLVTFHRLSERLTRIELNLDVVPTNPSEAIQLATRIADRRAETELRRFKARLELINPDVYEDEIEADEPQQEPEDEAAEPDDAESDDTEAEEIDDQQEEDAA